WKVPHGSLEAVERFGEKLYSEEVSKEAVAEFEDIALDWFHQRPIEKQIDGNLASELGDIVWLTTALASNGGIDINEQIRRKLHQKDLVRLSGPALKCVEIDYLLDTGYNPTTATPYDEMFPEDFEEYDP